MLSDYLPPTYRISCGTLLHTVPYLLSVPIDSPFWTGAKGKKLDRFFLIFYILRDYNLPCV